MALGKKNIYRAKDHEGDLYEAELRQPKPDEWAEYKRELTDISAQNRDISIEQNYEVKVKFFDLLCEDISGVYEDKDGEKKPFSLKSKPIPPEELNRLRQLYGLPAEADLLDLIPFQFKSDAVTVLIDAFDEQVAIAKKNLFSGSGAKGNPKTK